MFSLVLGMEFISQMTQSLKSMSGKIFKLILILFVLTTRPLLNYVMSNAMHLFGRSGEIVSYLQRIKKTHCITNDNS